MRFLFCTFLICLISLLKAQVTRIDVNSGSPTKASTKTLSTGDNELVTLINGDLLHITITDTGFLSETLVGAPDKLTNFEFYDIDLDGDDDLYTWAHNKEGFYFFEKKDGHFVYQKEYDFKTSQAFNLITGDFDLDGIEDIMFNYQVYRHTGPYMREDLFRYPIGNTPNYRNAYMTDGDRDGDTDLLFHQNNFTRLVQNNGGDFSTKTIQQNYENSLLRWVQLIKTPAGDEYILYDSEDKRIKKISFESDTSFITDITDITLNAINIISEDLDSDGTDEILVVENNKLIVLKYDYQAFTIDTTVLIHAGTIYGAGVWRVGDTQTKLFIVDASHFSFYDVTPSLTFTFLDHVQHAVGGTGAQFIDVDGDFYTDVIQGSDLRRQRGTFVFDHVQSLSLPESQGIMEDVDDDGDADLVAGPLWYPNNGDLTFGNPETYPTPIPDLQGTLELLRYDIDEDGDIDILTYKHFQKLSLLINHNNEFFENPRTLDQEGLIKFNAIHTEIADIDNDGLNDILMATEKGLYYLHATSTVSFALPVNLHTSSSSVLSFDMADYNYDEFPDIILSYSGSTMKLYTGSSEGFTTSTFNAGNETFSVVFADVDRQDWLDIAYHHHNGLWYASTLNGTDFTKKQIDVTQVINPAIVVKDVNTDGLTDLILYSKTGHQIYFYLIGIIGKPGHPCPATGMYFYTQDQINQYGFEYGHCSTIPGDLIIDFIYVEGQRSTVKDLNPFINLSKIDGDFELHELDSVPDLTGFANLVTVGKNMKFYRTYNPSIAGMGKLQHVGGDFEMVVVDLDNGRADLSSYASLDTIGGKIYLDRVSVVSLEPILQPVIYSDLELRDVYIENLTGFEQVDTIHGLLKLVRTNMDSLEHFSNLKYLLGIDAYENPLRSAEILKDVTHIDSVLSLSGNPNLVLNEGFGSLKTLGGSFTVYASECNSFHHLDSIAGRIFMRINKMDDLSLASLDYVGRDIAILVYDEQDFNRFSRIDTIKGDFQLSANKTISLSGWENLRHIEGNVTINIHKDLVSLYELNDYLTIGGKLTIYGNTSLAYCDEPAICNHLAKGGEYSIYSNGFDCSDISEIRCIQNQFSGIVFHDYNENLIRDPKEASLSNIRMNLFPPDKNIITTSNGYYSINASLGDSVHVETTIPDNWLATGNYQIEVDSFIPGLSSNYGNDIGFKPDFTKREIQLTFHTGNVICNVPFDTHILLENKGTNPEKLIVEFQYPDHAAIDPGFTNFIYHDQDNHIIRIELDTLYPFFHTAVIIPMIAGPFELENQLFSMTISIFAEYDQQLELVEVFEKEDVLLCSYDPNDKQVISSNGSKDIHFNTSDALMYTIRFQNTGNFYATHVRLTDTISDLLDLSTFSFTGSSHPVEITLKGNVLIFQFDNIYLPDSTTDLKGSQGFVTFSIKPLATLSIGSEIENEVEIYFDYNDPVITNRVKSVVVEITSVADEKQATSLHVYPNPARDNLYLIPQELNNIKANSFTIFTTSGIPVASGELNGIEINIASLLPSLYFIEIKYEDQKTITGKFVKL